MFERYYTKSGALVRTQRGHILCLVAALIMLSLLLCYTFADTTQSDFFLRNPDQHSEGAEGKLQARIDQLSKQLASEPYKAELYYHLARAYSKQGWFDKAAQYTSQWIKFSNKDMVIRGSQAFMVDEKSDKVLVVDTMTNQVVKEINVDWLPKKMALAPGKDQIYVTNALSNTVSSINTGKLAVTKTIEVGRMPWNEKPSPQGDKIYVTNLKSDDVSVIDTETDTVLETVKVGQGPWGIAVSPDGHRLYVSNQDSQNIQVIDTGDYSIVDVISMGTHPQDIVLAPDDETKLYAIDRNVVSDEVEIYIVDLDDARIVRSLNVPGAGANMDPLLSRIESMSLNDKLALIGLGDLAKQEKQVEGPVKKPETEYPPKVAFMPHSPVPQTQLITAENRASERADLPMGGPAELMGTEPVLENSMKFPSDPASGEPLSMQELELFVGPPEPPSDGLSTLTKPDTPVGYYATVPPISSEKPLPITSKPGKATEAESIQILPQKTSKEKTSVLRIIIVVRHDTLWRISEDNYGKANNAIFQAIKAVNPAIKNIDKIYVDQRVVLPALDPTDKTVVVKRNDNLFRIALNNYGVVNEKIYAAILRENPHIERIELIEIGQKITLPALPRIFPRTRAS